MQKLEQLRTTSIKWIPLAAAIALTGCIDENPSGNDAATRDFQSGSATSSATTQSGSGSNQSPIISGAPDRVAVTGSLYSFTPDSLDADGDRLSFSIRNKPAWASFDVSSGKLWGTPQTGNARLERDIVISVSDGRLGKSLPAFSIFVVEVTTFPSSPTDSGSDPSAEESDSSLANSTPEIWGAPPSSAMSGTMYVFQPGVSDADGDELYFHVLNKPAWLRFDSQSASLSGTPSLSDIGTYPDIWIVVSDGISYQRLGPFSIDVTNAGNRAVTLAWEPPQMNEDGSPLVDLAGYRIRYGADQGAYANVIDTRNPGLTTYSIGGLVPGTYFFVVTAYTNQGVESSFSNEATVTLN